MERGGCSGVRWGRISNNSATGRKKEEGAFKGGKANGPYVLRHDNGRIRVTFENGNLDGVATVWEEKGKTTVLTWKDGARVE